MKCNHVKYLMPNYIDGLNSEETNAEISEHLEECADCRTVYEKMTAKIPAAVQPEDKDIDFLKKLKAKILQRIVWSVGTAIALCICYLLCRYAFIGLHGSYQFPVLLLLVSFVAVLIAAIIDGRKIMICTVMGYIGGFAAGIIFGVDGVDPGGGATNNWWEIWIISYIVLIFAGVVWEVVSRRIKK